MEKYGAEALYSAVKSGMHPIRTEYEHAQLDAANRINKISTPSTIRRWSESTLGNGKPLGRILKENAHLDDLDWIEQQREKSTPHVEKYTSWGTARVQRVHRWRLACVSVVLGDTKDRNDVSGQWYTEQPVDTSVDSPIFRWL